MLYLIGLGLNIEGISRFGFEILQRCKRVYLENYTVDFPYTIGELQEVIFQGKTKKLLLANREKVENLELIDEAKKMDVALLIYGSPLSATTHISLIEEAKRMKVKYKVIQAGSIFDAVAETGLQLYKFGKITSMPAWKKNFEPTSFMKIVEENMSINAHSLILIDIGLDFQNALEQLEISAKEYNITLNKLIVCQTLGTKSQKIHYKEIEELKEYNGIKKPYCIIIPSKLHFIEEEMLKEI
ncbi:MAG TPA: diphthine synthase [Candidatus Nanoarchaeia archaeon]|nr:diphthine synthase [Candidatus Nanoarchaeia archaeon]